MRKILVKAVTVLMTATSVISLGSLASTAHAASARPAQHVRPATTKLYYYKLVNYDGKCLDAEAGSATGRVQQYGCNKNLWQYWAEYPSGYGGTLIKNDWTGQCLAAAGDEPGSAVEQQTCTPSSSVQNWYTDHTKVGEYFEYVSAQDTGGCNVVAEEECAMHPSGGSSQDGKGIYIQYPNSQNNLHSFYWELGARL
jgi:hypothetical protein